jgi:integrase
MPFDEWPAVDQAAWNAAIRPGSLLEDGGPAADWSPQSRRKRIEHYGRWLSFLQLNGWLDNGPPGDRVRPEQVRAYIGELQAMNSPYTVLCYVEDLYAVMKVTAPDRDWSWLRRLANRLQSRAVSCRRKEAKVRPSADLYALGLRLMQEAEDRDSGPLLDRSIRFRDGLIIALLATRPLRRRNLAQMLVGRNLRQTTQGYWLHFGSQETKNGQPIDVPVPAALAPLVDRYLDHYRPVLLGGRNHSELWISRNGIPLAAPSIYHAVRSRTYEAFGVAINPHLFRDCAATSVAVEDPNHVRVAATLLGHTGLSTTQRHYDQSRMLAAGRDYQRKMLALRSRLRHDQPGCQDGSGDRPTRKD